MTSRNTAGKFSLPSSMNLTQTKTKHSGVCYLNPTVLVGASNIRLQKPKELQSYETQKMISFTGQQNPTYGTAPGSSEIRSIDNLHQVSHLCLKSARGTADAKRLRVVESTRLHCGQISLSIL